MPLDQRIHGKNGQIYMDADGASPFSYVLLSDLNKWTLDMSTDRVDVTAFGDTNKQRVAGLPDFSGTIAGRWNALATSGAIRYIDAVLAGIPVQLKLVPNSADATVFFSGLANVDGSISVPVDGAVDITGKWDAAGNWTLVP